jgi:sugar O-acyltransferase (sialic acid O-acetyltransferase NeuD family)
MAELVGVYGSGGCGRGILPLVRSELIGTNAELVFIDDGRAGGQVNGHAILSFDDFLARPAEHRSAVIAIASSKVREKLAHKCEENRVSLRSAKAANAVFMDDVVFGAGACISPFCTFTSNIRIGKSFHANLYSYVEHDCIIGDFVTFAPGAKCNGNVVIEDHVYIGSNAAIKNGAPGKPLIIGKGAVVGMGAVVTKNVEAGATIVGNPAQILKKG